LCFASDGREGALLVATPRRQLRKEGAGRRTRLGCAHG
jgi:hypothetical protein